MRVRSTAAICVAFGTVTSTALVEPREPMRYDLGTPAASGEAESLENAAYLVGARIRRTGSSGDAQKQAQVVGESFSARASDRAIGAEASVEATVAADGVNGGRVSASAASRSSARSASRRP